MTKPRVEASADEMSEILEYSRALLRKSLKNQVAMISIPIARSRFWLSDPDTWVTVPIPHLNQFPQSLCTEKPRSRLNDCCFRPS